MSPMVGEGRAGRRVDLGVFTEAQRHRASAPFAVGIFIAVVRGTLYAVLMHHPARSRTGAGTVGEGHTDSQHTAAALRSL